MAIEPDVDPEPYTVRRDLSRPLRDWDLDALVTLSAGAQVQAEGDPDTVARVVRAVEGDAVVVTHVSDLGRGLHTVHPLDRSRIVAAWRHARDHPGEVVEVRSRSAIGDGWVEARQRFLSLHGHPELGVFCIFSDLAAPVDVAGTPLDSPVVYGTLARWVLVHATVMGAIESVEGTIEELLGVRTASLIGSFAADLVHPDDQATALEVFASVIRQPGRAVSAVHRLLRPDGTTLWVESTLLLTPPPDHPSGQPDDSTLVILIVDATGRRAQEAALEASREEARGLAEEFRLLAQEVPSAVFRADIGGRLQFANSQFVELAGGRSVAHLADLAHPSDHERVEAARLEALRRHGDGHPGDGTVTVEFRSALPEGGSRSLRVRAPRRASGAPSGLIGVLTDSTPTVRLLEQARTDPLTGLRNRTALDDHIESAIAAGRGVAVMFIDLDRFKEVNDAHGHQTGDAVLQIVAKRLRGCTRPTEMVTRYGGDEFVIVSVDPSPDIVDSLTRRVHRVLDHPIHVDGLLWQPSASLGLALSEPGDGPADVLRRADQEMYVAKQRRRRRG